MRPLGEFHKDKKAEDGRRNVCRTCRSERGLIPRGPSQTAEEEMRSRARQVALKKLVENHEREFNMLVGRQLESLRVRAEWKVVI